jgi:hypothetical protein
MRSWAMLVCNVFCGDRTAIIMYDQKGLVFAVSEGAVALRQNRATTAANSKRRGQPLREGKTYRRPWKSPIDCQWWSNSAKSTQAGPPEPPKLKCSRVGAGRRIRSAANIQQRTVLNPKDHRDGAWTRRLERNGSCRHLKFYHECNDGS